MKDKSSKSSKNRLLRVVKSNPDLDKKTDWSNPYVDAYESGRGIIEYDGKLTNIIIRYFIFERGRFERFRSFAEIFVGNKKKFIIDSADPIALVNYITEVAWPIVQIRKKIKNIFHTNIHLVKRGP